MTRKQSEAKRRIVFARMKEGATIHVGTPDGNDYTLCGAAYDGENGDEEMVELSRGKVNCDRCIGIVAFCKAIPSRALSKVKP